MFPISWSTIFRKKDGSLVNMEDALSGGGGGYTLPTASAETKGGVKIGTGLTMDGEVLSVTGGGGGGSLYMHCLDMCKSMTQHFLLTLFTTSSTPFTPESLFDLIYNSSIENGPKIGVFGQFSNTQTDNYNSIHAFMNASAKTFSLNKAGGSAWCTLAEMTMVDTVISL